MSKPHNRNRQVSTAVKLALMAGSLPLIASQSALAQEAEGEAAEFEEITVTGSRIPARNLISSSPVTTLSSDEIAFQGVTRIEDMLNRLPQVYADQTSTLANGATLTATVDLRGLGSERTLVLVNGRRLPSGCFLKKGFRPSFRRTSHIAAADSPASDTCSLPRWPVRYPAFFNTVKWEVSQSFGLSGPGVTRYRCFRSYVPVKRQERPTQQVEVVTKELAKRTPPAASRSIFGVSRCGWP